MDQKFILAACKTCPSSRLVGGEPPNWTKQFCAFHVDNAAPTPGRRLSEVRATIEVEDLRTMTTCPDVPRAARYGGAV